MHGQFCPIHLIHPIGQKSIHFEKTRLAKWMTQVTMCQLVSIFHPFDFIGVDTKMTILGTLASKANVHNIVSLVIAGSRV